MRSILQSIRARRGQNDRGFTLIELLVVVVIIGVLIAIAIPLYLNYQKSSHDKAADSDARNAIVSMENCFTQTGVYEDPGEEIVGDTGGSSEPLGASCTDKVNVSPGTVLNILAGDDGQSYTIESHNKNGHDDAYFCYDSTEGGSVVQHSGECDFAGGAGSGDTGGEG